MNRVAERMTTAISWVASVMFFTGCTNRPHETTLSVPNITVEQNQVSSDLSVKTTEKPNTNLWWRLSIRDLREAWNERAIPIRLVSGADAHETDPRLTFRGYMIEDWSGVRFEIESLKFDSEGKGILRARIRNNRKTSIRISELIEGNRINHVTPLYIVESRVGWTPLFRWGGDVMAMNSLDPNSELTIEAPFPELEWGTDVRVCLILSGIVSKPAYLRDLIGK
jgi:hypothetical protein